MIISDWWSKMLKHIHRIGDDHCRTLLKHFPNPFDFMKKLIVNLCSIYNLNNLIYIKFIH